MYTCATCFHQVAANLHESCVSNQRFGAWIKKSHEPLKFQNTYDITKPRLLKSHDFNAPNLWFETQDLWRFKASWSSVSKSPITRYCWIKSFFFFFFTHKKYSCRFIMLRLNHRSHMTWFKYVFSSFLGIVSVNCLAGNAGLTEPSDFIKNILICVPKMNEDPAGMERHEGE